jgi:hypothetical protein
MGAVWGYHKSCSAPFSISFQNILKGVLYHEQHS